MLSINPTTWISKKTPFC